MKKERIMANGGQIYQTKTNIKIEENFILRTKILLGPYIVYPGRLSVSRTIGDAEGKIPLIGGIPNVIISKPDIYKYNILENTLYNIINSGPYNYSKKIHQLFQIHI